MCCGVYPFGHFRKIAKSGCYLCHICPSDLCLSVRPHGTTLLPLDGFLWNLVFDYFSKRVLRKFKIHNKLTRITSALHEDQYTFVTISRSYLLRMRNASDKNYTKNEIHILCSIKFFSPENRAVCKIMCKNIVEPVWPQMTIWCMRIATILLQARTRSI